VARKRPQFLLADLVAIIAVGGLALALIRTGQDAEAIGISVLFGFVFLAWNLFRLKRAAHACEVCGRRFIAPKLKASPPLCPQCGQTQIGRGRTRKALAIGFWAVLALLSLTVVLMCFLPVNLVRSPLPFVSWVAPPLATMLLMGLFFVLLFARFMADSPQLKPVPCEKCGFIVPANTTTGPLICNRCQLQHLPKDQLRKQQAKGFGIILGLLLMVGMFAGFLLSDFAGSYFGMSFWLIVLLVVMATMVGLPVVLFVVLVLLNLVRGRRLRDEPFILAWARKVSGDKGEVLRSAQATVWYSGPASPVPQLMEQIDATRKGLEALLKREMVGQPPIRILIFEKRSAFQAFFQPFFAHLSTWLKTLDGLYIRSPRRILAISTEEVPYEVVDPAKTMHELCSYYFMIETSPDNPPAAWLQRGICQTLASDPDDRARLNRKMLVSLSKRTALAADHFKLNDTELSKLIKGWSNYSNFEKLEQYSAESWSVCEYLTGKQAPAERRDRFRAFYSDDQSKAQPEQDVSRRARAILVRDGLRTR
jgi:predicted RNA-binding Zn-ribbon protein involved in translation (DUF1610 family)